MCKGYPNEDAAHVALETVRSWLETDDHHEKVIFWKMLVLVIHILYRLNELSFVFSLILTIKYTNV